MDHPLCSVVMGSRSDLPTLQMALDVLVQVGVAHEALVMSAHRAPEQLIAWARGLEGRGVKVVIAAAAGGSHLPGLIAALTPLPVLGVPIHSHVLDGVDSLLSIVQAPRGVPVGTLAIGGVGAWNAGLLAAQILALSDPELRRRVHELRERRAGTATEVIG